MRCALLGLAACLGIAGCAPAIWDKPGGTQAQFNIDEAQCQGTQAQFNILHRHNIYQQCMTAKGYTARQQQTAAAGVPAPDPRAAQAQVREIVDQGKTCVSGIRAKVSYVALQTHSPDLNTGQFSIAQMTDERLPTPEEGRLVAAYFDEARPCMDRARAYITKIAPAVGPIFEQAHTAAGAVVLQLAERRLTWGQAAQQQQKLLDDLKAKLTAQAGGSSPATPQSNLAVSPQIPSTSEGEIRLQRKGGSYLVPVAVNGLPPIPFVLDSGADFVALPAEVVFTLLRTGTLRSSDFIGDQVFVMADGRKLPSFTFKIRELRVGQHVIPNVVGSLNPALTDPLLGGSFLSRFASWKIDNQRNALVLSR